MIETGESSKFNTTIVCRNCGQRLDVGANDTVPPCPRCGENGCDPNDYYDFERGTAVYNCETNDGACPRATNWSGKIALMYPSDYMYATDLSLCQKVGYNIDPTLDYRDSSCSTSNWLFDNSNRIWTMTKTTNNFNNYAINTEVGGNITSFDTYLTGAIKPVVYLNQDVIITITANEEIKEIEGWSLSKDKKVLTKKFTSNIEEDIIVSDLAGNTISDTIKIDNIDKTAPKIEVTYSTTSITDKDVIVTITSDKIIKEVDIPVIYGGGLNSQNKINEILNRTDIDFVSMQRPFIADPTFLVEWQVNGNGESFCQTCHNCYAKKTSICHLKPCSPEYYKKS